MEERRLQRVTEAIRDELSEIIAYELDDPRIGSVQLVDVHLSPDGRRAVARVRVEDEQSLAALDHARPFLRRQLAGRLDLFRTPDLHFEADLSATPAAKLPHLLKRVRKGRPRG
jgi:ribosome-binding factor A